MRQEENNIELKDEKEGSAKIPKSPKPGGTTPRALFKLLLDILMIPLFISMLFYSALGADYHEIAGLITIGLFALHIALNAKWTIRAARNWSRASDKLKVQLVLDELMILTMVLLGISGAAISTVVFNSPETLLTGIWTTSHTVLTWVGGLLLLAHVLLHIPYMVSIAGRIRFGSRGIAKTFLGFAAGVFALGILYWQVEAAFSSRPAADTPATVSISRVVDEDEYSSSQNSSIESTPSTSETPTIESTPEAEETPSISQSPAAETPTLEDFLGKLVCTGCHRQCSLLNPHCSKGERQAQQAEQEYSAQYAAEE